MAMRVALSIGHDPKDRGAVAFGGDAAEFDLLAPVAGYALRALTRAGVEALLVPTVDLGRKVDWVNFNGPFSLIVELHGNADPDADGPADPQADGCLTLFMPGNPRGELAAKAMQAALVQYTGQQDDGVKPGYFRMDPNNQPLFWLRKTRWLALLVEFAYVDEPGGACLLEEEASKAGLALAAGVLACKKALGLT